MFLWSRIQNHRAASIANSMMLANEESGCKYHNLDHIKDMYEYLDSIHEPYDEVLDWAVLYHDVIYDNQPNKEYRSAEFWKLVSSSFSDLHDISQSVYNLILTTKDHLVTDGQSILVRADLQGLADPVKTFWNFTKILQESMILYGIDERIFAENSISFMHDLRERVKRNVELDPTHQEFYEDVKLGIDSTINLSRILKGEL